MTVGGFWVDPRPVTNAEFGRFVRATGTSRWPSARPTRPTTGAPGGMLGPASSVFARPSTRSAGRHVQVVDVRSGRQLAAAARPG